MTQEEFVTITMATAEKLGLKLSDISGTSGVEPVASTTTVVESPVVTTEIPVVQVGVVQPIKKTQSEIIGENIEILQSSLPMASDNKPKVTMATPYFWAIKSADGKTFSEKGVYHLAHCKWSTGTDARNAHKDLESLRGSLKSVQKAGKADPTKKATFRIGAKIG